MLFGNQCPRMAPCWWVNKEWLVMQQMLRNDHKLSKYIDSENICPGTRSLLAWGKLWKIITIWEWLSIGVHKLPLLLGICKNEFHQSAKKPCHGSFPHPIPSHFGSEMILNAHGIVQQVCIDSWENGGSSGFHIIARFKSRIALVRQMLKNSWDNFQ